MAKKKIFKKIIDWLEDPKVVFILFTLILTIILHLYVGVGKTLIVILIAFFASDILFVAMVSGNGGIGKIPILGNKIQSRGYVYFVYYLAIILTTIASVSAADFTISQANSLLGIDWINDLIASALFSLLVYFDMKAKFYNRKR